MIVRAALVLDINRCLDLAAEYAEEAKDYSSLNYDEIRTATSMAAAIKDPDQMIFLAIKDNILVGLMWGVCTCPVWSFDKMATDMFLYVSKGHRDLFTATSLVKAYEDWAHANGAVVILTGASSGIDDNRAAKALYRHLGFREGGQNFYKRR